MSSAAKGLGAGRGQGEGMKLQQLGVSDGNEKEEVWIY